MWGIRFATPSHGFVFGTGLWETTDGGEQWAKAASPAGSILSLEVIDGQVLALTAPCSSQSGCGTATLIRRPVGGGRAWRSATRALTWQTDEVGNAKGEQVRAMTYYQAAIEILRAAKRPLTTQEITDQALKSGLITTKGKTPEATMSAELYARIRTDPDLVKLEDRSKTRAKRGSVRWTLRHSKP